MVVLVLGDVVGMPGCTYVRENLGRLKERYRVDIVVANGENSAEGNGILPRSAKHLFDSGVDVITTGNHVLKRREIYETLEKRVGLIRPANYHPKAPGAGYYIFDNCRLQLCVINLQGIVYMQSHRNPFECIDELLGEIKTPNILVDFHAEATAEKLCLGYYLDGRVSAVVGTHTHVPTADARILPGGTGYITDLGMCGGLNSVLGVKAGCAIEKLRTSLPNRFETDPAEVRISGVVLEINEKNGKCTKIKSLVMV